MMDRRRVIFAVMLVLSTACTLVTNAPPTLTPLPTATFTHIPTMTLPATEAPLPTLTPTPVPALVQPAFVGVGNQLYLWEAPSNLSRVQRMVTANGTWSMIGRTADKQWLQVELDDSSQGWFAASGIPNDIDWDNLPVTGESIIAARVVLIPEDSPERTFYPDGSTDATTLQRLQPVIVDGISTDAAWLHVATPQDQSGWIAIDGIELTFDPSDLQILEFAPPAPSNAAAPAPTEIPVDADARVKADAGGLRLRQLPGTSGTILFNMQAGTPLTVQGRTTDSSWVLVQMPEGFVGWTAAAYLEFEVALQSVPAVAEPEPAPYVELAPPEGAVQASIVRVPDVSAPPAAPEAAAPAPAAPTRGNIFTTVGDSLTDSQYFLRHINYGYNLREYGYLLPTVQYYNVDTGYGNAFSRRAFSTRSGWSTVSLFEPGNLAPECNPGENVVACEFRLTRPSVALIMIGTNDAPAHSAALYRENLERIINIALQNGTIPILSTLPPRRDQFNGRIQEYNQVIVQLSAQYSTPLVDLHAELIKLPNQGLAPDGIHLSIPPAGASGTMDFTPENLQYGTTVRNLTTLQILHSLR